MTSKSSRKRVLFVNPAKEDNFAVTRLHMGLTLMADTLTKSGHDVCIVDYAFLKGLKNRIPVPRLEDILASFRPDVIGISVFTYLYEECKTLVEKLSSSSEAPIVLGGPHFAVFPEDFSDDIRVSYIVRGEADVEIRNFVESATKQSKPVILNVSFPSASQIPEANLDVAVGFEQLYIYQIQLSRGCPYKCTFCNIQRVAGRSIRARDIEECIAQIKRAKARHPGIKGIAVTDDCPSFDKERFKRFLRLVAVENLGCELWVDNVRANLIDEETVQLYKAAGGVNLCLGVESGDPDVFGLVNKGESLDEIAETANLVKRHGLTLGMCFVIGLPGDTLRKHRNSVALAKRIKPDYIFWNMCIPWPGTDVYDWFVLNGTIGDIRGFSTLIDSRLCFRNPVAWSNDFSREDRIKAWLSANMETHAYFINLSDISLVFRFAWKYGLLKAFCVYLVKTVLPQVREWLHYLPVGVNARCKRLLAR